MGEARKATVRWVTTLLVLRTYALNHNQGEALSGLMAAYNTTLNAMQHTIFQAVEWRRHQIRGKKQCRLFPTYRRATH